MGIRARIHDLPTATVTVLEADDALRSWWAAKGGAPASSIGNNQKLRETVEIILSTLVRLQSEVVRKGPIALVPLVRSDVATETRFHESTVSRVVKDCDFIHCEESLRADYFFSPAVESTHGPPISATKAKVILIGLIAQRPKETDEAIRHVFERDGVRIARRTIAKYREELGFPSDKSERVSNLVAFMDTAIERVAPTKWLRTLLGTPHGSYGGAQPDHDFGSGTQSAASISERRKKSTSEVQETRRSRAKRVDVDAGPVGRRILFENLNDLGDGSEGALSRRRNFPAASVAERHRRLFHHFATYGELTRGEAQRLGVAEGDLEPWLDSLVVSRPGTMVVSPLFLTLVEGNSSPAHFTTQLALRLMGDDVRRIMKQSVESLEPYVWERFGSWHIPQPRPQELEFGYLQIPTSEAADREAAERLDLFAQLPRTLISALIRDTSFVAQQQRWSAQVAGTVNLGVLSMQLKLGVLRPLFLSRCQMPDISEHSVPVRHLAESEVLARAHVIAGIALCTPREWAEGIALQHDELVMRLLAHPLYAAIVQLEVHRLMAALSGQVATSLRATANGSCAVEVQGTEIGPLWKVCRTLLTDVGFRPAAQSLEDAQWASAVQDALVNLLKLGIMENVGGLYRTTESFGSDLMAHPSRLQNRGEKPFRVRLSQYIESLQTASQ